MDLTHVHHHSYRKPLGILSQGMEGCGTKNSKNNAFGNRFNTSVSCYCRNWKFNVLRKNNIENIKGELYGNSLDFYSLYSYKQFI